MAERRRMIQRREVTVNLPVVHAPGWLAGFVAFIREQGVVGLAVGFILGVAAKGVVDSLVANIINPIIGVLYKNGGQLADKFWCIKHSTGGVCVTKMGYGSFLNTLINFLVVAGVVYFIVKGLKLDRLDKPKS